MIEFEDINFRSGPEKPCDEHHHHPFDGGCPPFDPKIDLFNFVKHVDGVAHKALDIAKSASLDAIAARKLAEQALKVLNKVSILADRANVKADTALTEIAVLKDLFNALTAELDATQKGAGLSPEGKYIKNTSANYISNATSLADADNKLDEALKEVDEKTDDVQGQVTALNNAVTALQTKVRQIETIQSNIIGAVGLQTDGNYQPSTHSYINTAGSVLEATDKLARKIEEVRGNVTTNSNAIQTLQNKNLTIDEQVTAQGISYVLKFGGVQISPSIKVDKDRYLQDARYDAGAKKVILIFNDSQQIEIPVGDLFNIYEAGKGIELASDGKTFNIKLANHAQAEQGGLLSFEGNQELDAHIYEGEGLESYDHTEQGRVVGYGLKVKISPNSQSILNFDATGGLQVNIANFLAGNIIGDDYINVNTTPDGKVQISLNVDAVTNLIEEHVLWQPKDGNSTLYIEPKAGKSVFVNGTITATGAIYSGEE